ncbi:biotin--[acetyl-CoA-carboxylase] ligase [soil metagenome]
MNIPLLQRLRAAGGEFVPLSALGPDPARVGLDLEELEAFGFELERHPVQGIAYRGPARRLCPEQIEWELGTQRLGRRIQVWGRVGSTNDIAARCADAKAEEGFVVLAEEQTAGRGRRGRSWSAPPGSSILLSVLLFPVGSLAEPLWLMALGALATAEVVEAATGRPARIKWPNDVRVEGCKVAGILVERGQGVVLGIGLNVDLGPDDFPEDLRGSVTSLRMLSGGPFDRSELARRLIQGLDRLYGQGLSGDFGPLDESWRSRFEPLGRSVRLETHSGLCLSGRLVDASLERGLTLARPDGDERRINGPDVRSISVEE